MNTDDQIRARLRERAEEVLKLLGPESAGDVKLWAAEMADVARYNGEQAGRNSVLNDHVKVGAFFGTLIGLPFVLLTVAFFVYPWPYSNPENCEAQLYEAQQEWKQKTETALAESTVTLSWQRVYDGKPSIEKTVFDGYECIRDGRTGTFTCVPTPTDSVLPSSATPVTVE